MAVEVAGTMIRVPQGDTGIVKFVPDEPLGEACRALFTVSRRNGGALLRKVLVPDERDGAFYMPLVYEETATMKPDRYEWSLRVVRGGQLDAQGRLTGADGSHTAVLRGQMTVLPVAGGAR